MRSWIANSALPLSSGNKDNALGKHVLLKIDVLPQEQTKWCWAAIGSALVLFYRGLQWSQARVARVVLKKDCEADPLGCNMNRSMQTVLAAIQCEGSGFDEVVDLDAIAAELTASRPVVLRVERGSALAAHFVLVKGCAVAERLIEIDDPDGGATQSVSFDALRSGQVAQLGRWTNTIWTGSGA